MILGWNPPCTTKMCLKGAVKQKGKRYETLKLHARELAEDADDMAGLMGEKETIKTKLDAMKEMLAE